MYIEHFSVPPLGCNCVIIADETKGEALVVDPGGDVANVLARLAKKQLRCVGILHTHSHFDHVGGTKALQDATSAPTMIHEDDLFLYQGLQMQLDDFGIPLRAPAPGEVDRFLVDGEAVHAGDVELGVLHTPGHTPGSLCFATVGDRPIVLAGDTLFQGSIGRSDLWGGDGHTLLASIREKLLVLPDETLVITGHGPTTTIGAERRRNPFLVS